MHLVALITALVGFWLQDQESTTAENDLFHAQVIASEEVSHHKVPSRKVRRYEIEVLFKPTGETFRLLFGGSRTGVRDDIERMLAVDGRLVIEAGAYWSIFDLIKRKEIHHDRVASLAISPDGRRVAWLALRRRFNHKSSSIVGIMRIEDAEPFYPFPQPMFQPDWATVRAESPEERHWVWGGDLFWHPAGDRLFFVCAHLESWYFGSEVVRVHHFVVLNSRSGDFKHVKVPRELYLQEEVLDDPRRASYVPLKVGKVYWLGPSRLEIETVKDPGLKPVFDFDFGEFSD